MKHFEITTAQQGTWTFDGLLLGVATSEGGYHNHESEYVTRGKTQDGRKIKCNACRWHEVAIYLTSEDDFVLHTVGRTIVPGEIDFARLARTTSAFELVEMTVVRGNTNTPPYLPRTSAQALAQAADKDDRVYDAYVNRAVV